MFGFKALSAQKQISKANERSQKAHYDQTIQDLSGQIQAARDQLKAAQLVAQETPTELAAARQSETQSRARYQSGLATLVEVADAENLLAQAEMDDSIARLNVWHGLFAVASAQGNLQDFLQLLARRAARRALVMWLIRAALRRPITVIVIVLALALSSILALLRTRIDIFPDLNLPVIYVAQPYGGMSPQQMEGFLSYYYEYHFLYINGIESVEAKSIQGIALLRLTFHAGTDMSEALAQTISYVNRARAFMPPGTVSPFVFRYDAGTLPVGYLVFSSESRTLGEIQDLALNRVRPIFATLPGVSSPPPFGGNQRTIVVSVDPGKLHAYGLSPQSVVQALVAGNSIEPAGNANIGNYQTLVTTDSTVGQITDLLDIPLRTGSGPSVYLRDVGTVSDSSDIPAGYALLNDKRTVYIPVTKRPDASTITVVNEVRASLPRFQSLVPEDIKITYEFDQSQYVRDALLSVLREGLLGAILTGLTLLFFLRDWRSSLVVVITIPFALLMAVVALWVTGQTINIMTLGGLALAVGVLVDEGTVLLENIHVHLAQGEPKARAVLEASREVAIPRLLAMLCVLAVFLPSFFMVGPARSLFVPLSLAVGFSMGASYLLSSSLVPVLSNWLLKAEKVHADKLRGDRFRPLSKKILRDSWIVSWPVRRCF